MKRNYYERLISYSEKGIIATILRGLLSLLALIYLIILRIRKILYALRIIKRNKLPCTVISVGNISLGGTGKTPFVEFISKLISEKGMKTAIVTRGYKHAGAAASDEALLLAEKIPQIPLFIAANRYLGGKQAIKETKAQCVVLDDAFQHWRIERDLDIVLIDALNPFGYGRLFPRGMLREPILNLSRADLFVITKADFCPENVLQKLRDFLANKFPDIPQVISCHKPVNLGEISKSKKVSLEYLRGKRISAFCGIGNPESFQLILNKLCAEVIAFNVFSDHFLYSENLLSNIEKEAALLKSEAIVTTHKDAVKVRSHNFSLPAFYLEIEIEIMQDSEIFDNLIAEVIHK
ncbi:MAG: tetraacyldisaccharide 4'-kinase [Planctomycetota bacterium]